MTLFQETASAPTAGHSERAFTAQLLAITAGLVVVLMAVAVTSYVAGRPAEDNIQASADTALTDGWQSAVTAAGRQREMDAANALTDGWAAALVPQRTFNAAEDAAIQRFLQQEAAADGNTLRVPMQPEESALDGYNQRFLNAD